MRIIGLFWNKKTELLVSLLAAGLLFVSRGAASAEDIQVVKSGKYYGTTSAYRIGENVYLGAKESAGVYGGQVYWYAVRGEVRLSLRGKQIQFAKDSATVDVNGKSVDMPRAMIVRAGKAFIPIEFFTSKNFSDVAGVDSKFNPTTHLLLVDQRSNVGPLRWFTYSDHTRIVVEIAEDLSYQTSKRGRFGFALDIPNGSIDWSERTDIKDGVVESIHLYEESGRARLAVVLLPGSDGMQVREFKNPRRVVIDVARSEDADAVQSARRRSLEAPPAPDKSDADIAPAQMRGDPIPAGEASSLAEKAAEAGKAVAAAAASAAQAAAGIAASAPPASGKVFRIAIDAGHGGKDGGAVGRRGTLEKDINLKAAEDLAGLLRQEGMFEVFLTRSDDTFVKLGQRSQLANKSNADLFVSIHCNAHTSRKESGFEIYFLSERASDPEAERLAEFENSVLALEGDEDLEGGAASVLYALAKTEFINDAAELAGLMTQSLARRVDLPNRGVRQAAFYVLRGTNSPAVLVEMGFLSNARDEAKLQSHKYRSKIVAGLYAGIVEFAKRHQPERRQ